MTDSQRLTLRPSGVLRLFGGCSFSLVRITLVLSRSAASPYFFRHLFCVRVLPLDLAHGFHLFAVLFGLVVLLAVLMKPVAAFDVPVLGAQLAMRAFMQLLHEAAVRLLAMLPFGVALGSHVPFPVGHSMQAPESG